MINAEILTEIFSPIFSWFIWVLIAYFCAIVTDYVTGTLAAYFAGEWRSSKARKGLIKKCLMLAVLIIPLLLDALIGLAADKVITLPWTFRGLFLPLATIWYMLTELGSIIENLGKLGVPVPAFLSRAIAALHKTVDDTAESIMPSAVVPAQAEAPEARTVAEPAHEAPRREYTDPKIRTTAPPEEDDEPPDEENFIE